jgi:hypothetical protein
VVNLASEAGLAVLVALRYVRGDPAETSKDYVLGWTEIDAVPERVPDLDEELIRAFVAGWLVERRSLLAAVRSQVLPEAERRTCVMVCRSRRWTSVPGRP